MAQQSGAQPSPRNETKTEPKVAKPELKPVDGQKTETGPKGEGGAENEGTSSIDQLSINTIRTLAMDAVQHANSGHPGTAMAMAPFAYTLWQEVLRYDPADPIWPDRDRFVLSAGHASMLLYALLHLAGVKAVNEKYEQLGTPAVSLEDIKRFRQLDSKCTGHPEYHLTTGVETTTGPLGQGVATSIGMAIAGQWMAAHFNKPDFKLFDHDVFVLCGDGDMMEGVSSEAASLAGHLMLGNLCWIYDNNRITIDGATSIAFSDDVGARFKAYGWNVIRLGDANDTNKIREALAEFRSRNDVPTLIVIDSIIGYGSPHKQGTPEAHGEPLGVEEVRLTKRAYGWPEDAQFLIPDGVLENFQNGIGKRGKALRDEWAKKLNEYKVKYPDLAMQLELMQKRELPEGWDKDLPSFPADAKGVATRTASGKVMNAIAKNYPWLMGGSADLQSSTATRLTFEGAGDFEAEKFSGRNVHFGIREHVMATTVNGMALSKVRAFGSTYLIFSDYMKPAIRLSALMEVPSIFIFTHDSIGLGEDGPTHQPVEQLIALRTIPGLITLRPADANEVTEAWRVIVRLTHQPVCLVLTRQPVPVFDRKELAPASGLAKGAYTLADAENGKPDVILIGTGSEVGVCLEAYRALQKEGIKARVVSMPSWELFEQQDEAYRHEVLPPDVTARVSVEEGSVIGWDHYVGMEGAKIGMHTFGSSAPLKDLMTKFGFTPEKIAEAAKQQLSKKKEKRA